MDLTQVATKIMPGVPFKSSYHEDALVFDEHWILREKSLSGRVVTVSRSLLLINDFEVACKHPVDKAVQSVNHQGFAPFCSLCGLELQVESYITKPPVIPDLPKSTPINKI